MEERPAPALEPDEVLCQVVRSGICGTDYAIYTGEFSFVKSGAIKFPMTPGHEWAGRVTAVGPEVKNFKPGDRVVSDTVVSCGVCYQCLMGRYPHCKKLRCVGTIHTWDGAYADYIKMPARHLFHLPDAVSFDNGAMVEPAATALNAVRLAGVTIGDTVLVHGSGPIGIMAAKLAKISGAARVIITGRKDFKLQKALELGVDSAINVTRGSLRESLHTGVGDCQIDRVIEASGSVELLKESLTRVRPGGIIALVAFYEKRADQFDVDSLVFRDLTLRGVAGSLGMYAPVLNLMASGLLELKSLITSRHKLEEVPAVFKTMEEKNRQRIKMMIEG